MSVYHSWGRSDSQRIDLGLTVRSAPTPIPVPSTAPGLDAISTNSWIVSIRLHDSASTKKRGKPAGVSGASVFSFVGAEPTMDISQWKFEGNTGKTLVDVEFPNSLVAGTKMWITAFWFNNRKQSGPAGTPVSAYVQFGQMTQAA